MLFNSLDFAIFLPIVFILYWFVTDKNLTFLEQKVSKILLVFAPIPSDTYKLYNNQIDTIKQMYSKVGFYRNYNGISLNDKLRFKDDDH